MPSVPLADSGKRLQLSEERMRQLAAYLVRLIEQGEHERNLLEERWRQSRSDYDNQPIPFISNFIKGVQDIPHNFAQPRADALGDFVINGIVTQSPLVTCWDMAGKEDEEQQAPPPMMGMMPMPQPEPDMPIMERRERTMDFLLRRGMFSERLKTVSVSAWCTNHGILRLSYGGPEMPLRFDAITPEDFICVGSSAYTIEESRCVGHRFERARGELKILQHQGRYSDEIEMDDLQASTAEGLNTNDPSAGNQAAPACSDEDMIELWQLYVIIDPKSWSDEDSGPEVSGKERRFSAVIEPNTFTILRIEEYPYKRLCYFSFGYKPAPEKGFWHKRSVGADMQGPHRTYNCLCNMRDYGALMTAFAPLVANGGSFKRDQHYKPGAFIDMEAGDLTVPALNFDPSKIQLSIQETKAEGDSVARINQAGIAQPETQAKTATQSNNEAQGMRAGIGGFLETFSQPMPLICEHAEELLADTFTDWQPVYGENTPVESPEDMKGAARWDVPGKVPNLNPQVVLQNVQTLLNLVGEIAQMGGTQPALLEFGLDLLQLAMNAMDLPNADDLMEGLRAKISGPPPGAMNGATQGLGSPMVEGPIGMPGMGGLLPGMGLPPGLPMQAA